MSDKAKNIVFLITTSLLSLMMLATVGNSIFNSQFSLRFVELGYPAYLIAPLMTVKILGMIAIWINKSKLLKELAYAGFLFLFILAFVAEINAKDADFFSPPFAIILLITSYILQNKRETENLAIAK